MVTWTKCSSCGVKLVVQVKLQPTPEQASTLESTLRACNTAACEVAEVARTAEVYRNYDLRKHVYQGVGRRSG